MRLSDARLRRRQTKLLYPNHRLPSLAHRRRHPRSLEPIVRCHPTKPRPCPPKLQFFTTFATTTDAEHPRTARLTSTATGVSAETSTETADSKVDLECFANSGQLRHRTKWF